MRRRIEKIFNPLTDTFIVRSLVTLRIGIVTLEFAMTYPDAASVHSSMPRRRPISDAATMLCSRF